MPPAAMRATVAVRVVDHCRRSAGLHDHWRGCVTRYDNRGGGVIALDNDGSCLVDGVRGGDGRPDDAANDAAKNTAEDCVAIVAPVGEGVEG